MQKIKDPKNKYNETRSPSSRAASSRTESSRARLKSIVNPESQRIVSSDLKGGGSNLIVIDVKYGRVRSIFGFIFFIMAISYLILDIVYYINPDLHTRSVISLDDIEQFKKFESEGADGSNL